MCVQVSQVFKVLSTDFNAGLSSLAHRISNILEYSRHVSDFSGSYCDLCNQLLAAVSGVS